MKGSKEHISTINSTKVYVHYEHIIGLRIKKKNFFRPFGRFLTKLTLKINNFEELLQRIQIAAEQICANFPQLLQTWIRRATLCIENSFLKKALIIILK